MNLHHLRITTFRNYNQLSLSFPAEGAVFEGANGSGKTNILEAIYVLCTGRSQRGAKRSEMINFGSEGSFLEGEFTKDSISTTASMGFNRDKKVVMKINNSSVQSFSEWFGQRPVVSFGTYDLQLVSGTPDIRRKFIDILGSQIDSEYLSALVAYKHSLSCRNRLLSYGYDKIQCEIYEEQMAESGSEIFFKRQEILAFMNPIFSEFYKEISANKEKAQLLYDPSVSNDCSSKKEWKNVFYQILKERRNKDIETGFSSVGPHRDDIHFLLNQKPAKIYGSQGQCRSIVLSLKLSSVTCIEHYRKEEMILMIDDAVSELDQDRTYRVFSLIENKGQVFIASPYLGNLTTKSLLRCRVSDGQVVT